MHHFLQVRALLTKTKRQLITSVLALFAVPALAADPMQLNPAGPWYALNEETGWHFDLGIGMEYEPGYPGSDEYSAEPDIFGRALYRTESGHRYFLSLGEVGAIFSLNPKTQFLAFLEYEEEREDDDSALDGLDPVDATIEGQFMLARRFGNASVFGILQPDLTGDANKGLVWFVGASLDGLSVNEKWRWSTSLDLSGADSEYMQTEFGINAGEAARTDYSVYTPGSGLKSLSWGLNGEYYFSDRLSILATLETEYYLSKAADSPLIDVAGRQVGIEGAVQLRWRF